MRKCTADQIDSSWDTRGSVQEGHVHARLLSGLLLHIIGGRCPLSLATPIANLSFWVKTILKKQAKVYQTGRCIRIIMRINSERLLVCFTLSCPGLSNLIDAKRNMQKLHTEIIFLF